MISLTAHTVILGRMNGQVTQEINMKHSCFNNIFKYEGTLKLNGLHNEMEH